MANDNFILTQEGKDKLEEELHLSLIHIFARSETLEQMETDAYDLFSERVSSRAGYLENDMIFRWSDFDVVVEHVGDDIDAALAAHGASAADIVTGPDLSLAVIDASADDLLSFARRAEMCIRDRCRGSRARCGTPWRPGPPCGSGRRRRAGRALSLIHI